MSDNVPRKIWLKAEEVKQYTIDMDDATTSNKFYAFVLKETADEAIASEGVEASESGFANGYNEGYKAGKESQILKQLIAYRKFVSRVVQAENKQIEELKQAMRDIYEVWAGSDATGIENEAGSIIYQQRLIKKMVDIARNHL